MTWSYSSNPAASPVDEARFIIGDTNELAPIMQDEEIQYIIDASDGNTNVLYYNLFLQAATIFARDVKRSLGPQSEDPTERLAYYKSQAAAYKAKIGNGGVSGVGLSLPVYAHEKVFFVGMHSNPPADNPSDE